MLEPTDFAGFMRNANKRGFAWLSVIGRNKEFGTWTPVLTFDTPGDLSVSYANQRGIWRRYGDTVIASVYVKTSSFTYTTASGSMTVTGLPFKAKNDSELFPIGGCSFQGISKTSYSQVCAFAQPNTSQLYFSIDGMGQTHALVSASEVASAGTVILVATVAYIAD